MIKKGLFLVIIIYILNYIFYLSVTSIKCSDNFNKNNIINIIPQGTGISVKYNLDNVQYEEIKLNNISITSYNNESNQTDSTPNIMASNRLVYEGAIAISRDLKTKYNLKWGDLIYIETLQRYFVIEDLMGERFKNRLDIFSFDKKWSLAIHLKNQNIIIYKIKK